MASLRQIAIASGVSIRTVNRVLKKDGYVHARTRALVEESVRKVGYRPNLAARALKTARSHIVGVLAFTADELRMAQVAALEQRLRPAGYNVNLVFQLDQAHSKMDKAVLLEMIGQGPAGLVLMGDEPEVTRVALPGLIPILVKSGLPYVLLDPKGLSGRWSRFDSVTIDRARGVYDAVQHLAGRRASRIAFLGTRKERTRLDGYELALKQLKRKPIFLDYPGVSQVDLRELGRKVARQKVRPDAVVAHSDYIAMAFMAGLRDEGLRIPDDVAIVGFDDRPMARLAWPPLSTVAQPTEEVGRAAAEILLGKLDGKRRPAHGWSKSFPARLVLRETA